MADDRKIERGYKVTIYENSSGKGLIFAACLNVVLLGLRTRPEHGQAGVE
jgi:hypothetical protein